MTRRDLFKVLSGAAIASTISPAATQPAIDFDDLYDELYSYVGKHDCLLYAEDLSGWNALWLDEELRLFYGDESNPHMRAWSDQHKIVPWQANGILAM